MNKKTTEMPQADMNKLFRELRITRMVSIISSFLALLLLIWSGYLAYTVKGIVREVEPAMEKIARVDVESLNATLEHVNETLETVDLEPVVQAIEELDVEGLNTAIESLDMGELSEALKNLNDAADIFRQISQSFSESLGRLTSIFN